MVEARRGQDCRGWWEGLPGGRARFGLRGRGMTRLSSRTPDRMGYLAGFMSSGDVLTFLRPSRRFAWYPGSNKLLRGRRRDTQRVLRPVAPFGGLLRMVSWLRRALS